MAASSKMSLSVLIPVYNEQYLVTAALERLKCLDESEVLSRIEIIVVDDGSDDRTAEKLHTFEQLILCERREQPSKISWVFLRHSRNSGKGAAVRTALDQASGDIAVIQDADLEYDPHDILKMVQVFVEENADAVFGSRFMVASTRRALFYWHQLANKFLTLMCNLVSNLNLTDVWTCYKAVRTPLLKSIPLVSNDFRVEPELTIKLAKRKARIFEVPIRYVGRTYEEGKKIRIKDAMLALWAIARFGVSDNIFTEAEYGSQILGRLERASRFNAWMADVIRPFCGERILEIGAGTGNLTMKLIPRDEYVTSDNNHLYLKTLENLSSDHPYVKASFCDVTDSNSFPLRGGGYDTVICLNVMEHVYDDIAALTNIGRALTTAGRAIVLVPSGPWNFGTLDQVLGHYRRYTPESLYELAGQCGFTIERMMKFNRLGSIAWFLNGKILRRRYFGLTQIWLLNMITPLMRTLDPWLPLPAVSLIAVMRPRAARALQISFPKPIAKETAVMQAGRSEQSRNILQMGSSISP